MKSTDDVPFSASGYSTQAEIFPAGFASDNRLCIATGDLLWRCAEILLAYNTAS